MSWKPQQVKGNRCMAICYIDARDVMGRLDGVVGWDAWEDEYEVLGDGSVVCKLRVRFNGEWITKVDVGSPSEQPDGGDRTKAAFSDALKRAAVKFGIGRYLYSLPTQWVDYDPDKKRMVRPPTLPAWAKPHPPPPGMTTGEDLRQKQERWKTAIATATTVDALAQVWVAINKDNMGANRLLLAAKEQRKVELSHVQHNHPQGGGVQGAVPGPVPAAHAG